MLVETQGRKQQHFFHNPFRSRQVGLFHSDSFHSRESESRQFILQIHVLTPANGNNSSGAPTYQYSNISSLLSLSLFLRKDAINQQQHTYVIVILSVFEKTRKDGPARGFSCVSLQWGHCPKVWLLLKQHSHYAFPWMAKQIYCLSYHVQPFLWGGPADWCRARNCSIHPLSPVPGNDLLPCHPQHQVRERHGISFIRGDEYCSCPPSTFPTHTGKECIWGWTWITHDWHRTPKV